MVSTSTRPFWRSVSPVWVMSTMRSHSPVSGPSSIAPDSSMTSAVMPLRAQVGARRPRVLGRDPRRCACARSSTGASARSATIIRQRPIPRSSGSYSSRPSSSSTSLPATPTSAAPCAT